MAVGSFTFTVAMLLSGCDEPYLKKKEDAPSPTASPEEAASTPKPVAKAAAEPASLSEPKAAPASPRFAPKGIYYVVKAFSVMTDSGIKGFARGRQVSLVKESGNDVVVTDGEVQATVSRDSLTNDLLVVKELTQPTPTPLPSVKKKPAVAKGTPAKSAAAVAATGEIEQSPYEKQRLKAVTARKRWLQTQIELLNKNIAAAQQEISEKQSNQRPVRKTYSASGVLLIYQGRSSYTLSANASALPRMTAQLEKLQQELGTLP